ncbi:MAG: ABC transporter permease, partial [Clostridia bacterium]|nr:ABC transporter permease [Clostridia bacterium]
MPKAWITTRPLPIGNYKTDGITSYEADFAADMFLFDESDTPLSFRVFSVSKNSHRIFHIVEKSENKTDFPSIYVTAKFAESSGIHPGDILSVKAGTDTRVFVESIVSLPEALVCVRNDGSWQDANDFGYAYLSREDYDSIFDTSGLANQWFVCFEDGLTNNQKESALSVFASKIGGEQGSAVLFENSEIRKTIDVMVDALSTACRYFPMAIYIIGLFFGSLFVRQLVLGDRKKIGLLRALGYSSNQILFVFLRYILLLSVSAIVPGIAIGTFAVRTIAGIFREMYALPGMNYSFSLLTIIGLLLSVILVGIVSCLVSARNISKIDPSEAYCDIWHDTGEIPRFFKRIRLNPFVKTSIGSIIRGRSRFFRSVISICACMVLMISSLLYYATQNEVFPVTFGERFRYDFLVSVNSGEEIEKQLQNIVGVSETETVNTFRDELSFRGETKSVLVCAICDDGKLIVPSDVSGKPLHPHNGVILDEWTAKKIGACENDTVVLGNISLEVVGISRELVNSTQYISVNTAALLNKDVPEYIAIKLDAGADTTAVQKEIAGISGCVGITGLANQQKSYLEMIKLVNMVLIIIVGISLM